MLLTTLADSNNIWLLQPSGRYPNSKGVKRVRWVLDLEPYQSQTSYHLISHMQHKEWAKMINWKHCSKMQCTIPFIIHSTKYSISFRIFLFSKSPYTWECLFSIGSNIIWFFPESCHEWPWGKGQDSSLSYAVTCLKLLHFQHMQWHAWLECFLLRLDSIVVILSYVDYF